MLSVAVITTKKNSLSFQCLRYRIVRQNSKHYHWEKTIAWVEVI
jgi:hypothetical protein